MNIKHFCKVTKKCQIWENKLKNVFTIWHHLKHYIYILDKQIFEHLIIVRRLSNKNFFSMFTLNEIIIFNCTNLITANVRFWKINKS